MFFKQYYLGCLSHASYLIADTQSGVAAVIDPQRDVDQYLDDAQAQGLTIGHVLLTHFHADFASGHLELAQRCGAVIYLGGKGQAEYAVTALNDGDQLELGPQVRLGVLETPGHTPESVCIVAYDRERSEHNPHAVFTGDTLFIGDVGRPDLMASVGITAEELAGMMYDSLRDKLMPLPDDTLVYPAHGAGSMCGKNLSQERVSTIGEQKRLNHALQPLTRDELIASLTSDQPKAPRYFAYDADFNKRLHPTLSESLERALKPLSLDEVLKHVETGSQLLDTRDPQVYAARHLSGAINIGLGGSYATWAGTMLDSQRSVVLVAEPGREQEAALRLGRIGFDRVVGFLDGGLSAAESRPELLKSHERIEAAELARRLGNAETAPAVLDVRTSAEVAELSIDNSCRIPLNELEQRLDEVPRDRPLVVHCRSGYRSSIAAGLLEPLGLELADLEGGILAWQRL